MIVNIRFIFANREDVQPVESELRELFKSSTSDYQHDDVGIWRDSYEKEVMVDIFPEDLRDVARTRQAVIEAIQKFV